MISKRHILQNVSVVPLFQTGSDRLMVRAKTLIPANKKRVANVSSWRIGMKIDENEDRWETYQSTATDIKENSA